MGCREDSRALDGTAGCGALKGAAGRGALNGAAGRGALNGAAGRGALNGTAGRGAGTEARRRAGVGSGGGAWGLVVMLAMALG